MYGSVIGRFSLLRCADRSLQAMACSTVSVSGFTTAYRHLLTAIAASTTLYPPTHVCLESACPEAMSGQCMKKTQQCKVVLYTFSEGPLPAYAVHLYCHSESALRLFHCKC